LFEVVDDLIVAFFGLLGVLSLRFHLYFETYNRGDGGDGILQELVSRKASKYKSLLSQIIAPVASVGDLSIPLTIPHLSLQHLFLVIPLLLFPTASGLATRLLHNIAAGWPGWFQLCRAEGIDCLVVWMFLSDLLLAFGGLVDEEDLVAKGLLGMFGQSGGGLGCGTEQFVVFVEDALMGNSHPNGHWRMMIAVGAI
jgi:hypothetical protein